MTITSKLSPSEIAVQNGRHEAKFQEAPVDNRLIEQKTAVAVEESPEPQEGDVKEPPVDKNTSNLVLTVNKKFADILPSLMVEEDAGLETSVLAEGIRDPIVVWRRGNVLTIVDGHARYKIAMTHGLPYKTVEMNFEDEEAACIWIIENQKSRRNLTKSQLAMVVEKLASLPRGANQHAEKSVCSQSKVAKRFGISVDLIQQAKQVREKGVDVLIEAVETGRIPVGEGSKLARQSADYQCAIVEATATGKSVSVPEAIRERKIAEHRVKVETVRSQSIEMPTGKYSCIVIDPPWDYGGEYCPVHNPGASPYPSMTQDQLLDMRDIILATAEDDCIMFLWTTQDFIWDAKALLDHWEFKYRAIITWDKEKMGLGRLFRHQCEFCLVGLKGKPLLDNPKNIPDIIRERKREHSRKPEKFYEMADVLCPGSKVEYFAREQRPGFAVHGNETAKFNSSDCNVTGAEESLSDNPPGASTAGGGAGLVSPSKASSPVNLGIADEGSNRSGSGHALLRYPSPIYIDSDSTPVPHLSKPPMVALPKRIDKRDFANP